MMPMVVCKDPECRAHGKYVRRIQRLAKTVARDRRYLEETERALEINSDAVIELQAEKARMELAFTVQRAEARQRLARAWSAYFDALLDLELWDGTSVLAYVLATNPELRARLDAALNDTKDS